MSEALATTLLGVLLLFLAAGFAVGGFILVVMAGANGENPQDLPVWFPVVYAALLLAGVAGAVTMRLTGAGWVGVACTAAGCFLAAVALLVAVLAARFGS